MEEYKLTEKAKKRQRRRKFELPLLILYVVSGLSGVVVSLIFQIVLQIQRFGFVFCGETDVLIPHWSLFLNLTLIIFFIPYIINIFHHRKEK